MSDPNQKQRERELARRREQEIKDLDTEAQHGPRPLEGLSAGPTTWTQEQDEGAAEAEHGGDEAASQAASRAQVPPPPGDRTLPERGEGEE